MKFLESPIVTKIVCVAGALSLAVCLVATGFAACACFDAPTTVLSQAFSDEADSPFTRDELCATALQVKHYTIDDNDKAKAYALVVAINEQAALSGSTDSRAPVLDSYYGKAADELDEAELAGLDVVFSTADERYALSTEAMSHLDDVYRVVQGAKPWLLGAAVCAGVCAMATACRAGKRALGRVLFASGVAVLGVFVACGAAIVIDFEGFFQLFHSLFFAAGTWEFPYDSLLICMYPENFWMGMGTIWLVVTLACCIVCIVLGRKLSDERAVKLQA